LPSEHRIDRRTHVGELLVPGKRRVLDGLADRGNVASGYGPDPIRLESRVIGQLPNALASNLRIRDIVGSDHPRRLHGRLIYAPARRIDSGRVGALI